MGRPGRVDGTRELVVSGTSYIVPHRVRGQQVEVVAVAANAALADPAPLSPIPNHLGLSRWACDCGRMAEYDDCGRLQDAHGLSNQMR